MAIFLKLYLIWGGIVFALGLIVLYPLYALIIWTPNERLFGLAYYVNKLWTKFIYVMIFIPVKQVKKTQLNTKTPYVFVANHSSFLDIPAVQLLVDQLVIFLGKRSLSKVPLFGWMFKNIHICVDRGRPEKTEEMFRKCIDRLDHGYSIGVFPEGTQNRTPPKPKKFKDGAFIIAIRSQKPIVPVTIVNNWQIWPALAPWLSWSRLKLVQHEPIETKGLTLEDVPMLRDQSQEIIEEELKKHFPDKI